MRTREPELWKGLLAGAVAGLAAAWVMNQFQTGLSKIKQQHQQGEEESQHDQGQSEDATMKTAGAISRALTGKDLSIEQKKKLSPIVHYGFGTFMGAIYGGLSEQFPPASYGWGTAFGSALFIGADEIAVPLFGLAPAPTKSPLSTHLYAWASHLVYGAALESVRRPLRSTMGYDDWRSNLQRAQDRVQQTVETTWDDAGDYAKIAKKRARTGWKASMKNIERAARRMRKAA